MRSETAKLVIDQREKSLRRCRLVDWEGMENADELASRW